MAPFWVCSAPEFNVDAHPDPALDSDAEAYPAHQDDPHRCFSLCVFCLYYCKMDTATHASNAPKIVASATAFSQCIEYFVCHTDGSS
jgi:hypothetical protein